jgi:hypothetical protein
MTRVYLTITTLALLLAGGCSLEVEQHPPWIEGEYNNKPDNLPSAAYFHHDRLAWHAAIDNRNRLQNEYNRTTP